MQHWGHKLYTPLPCIKVTNRIGDKSQPWQSPVATEDALDLLLRTRFSLSSYTRTRWLGAQPQSFILPHPQNLSHVTGKVWLLVSVVTLGIKYSHAIQISRLLLCALTNQVTYENTQKHKKSVWKQSTKLDYGSSLLSTTQLLFWLYQTAYANHVIQIAHLCLTGQGNVLQAVSTSRMQNASLIISYMALYSHLLPVRLLTTGLQSCLSASACPPGSARKVAHFYIHTHTGIHMHTVMHTHLYRELIRQWL